jgi:hypothetical protein
MNTLPEIVLGSYWHPACIACLPAANNPLGLAAAAGRWTYLPEIETGKGEL